MVDPTDEEALLESEGMTEEISDEAEPQKYSKEELNSAGGDDLDEVKIEDTDEESEEEIEQEIEEEDSEAAGDTVEVPVSSEPQEEEGGEDSDQAPEGENDEDMEEEVDEIMEGEDKEDEEPVADIYGHQV